MIELNKPNDQHPLSVNVEFTVIVGVLLVIFVLCVSPVYIIVNYGYAGHGEFFKRDGVCKRIIGRPTEEIYHTITKTEGGFVGKLGAWEIALDREGKPLYLP